MVIRPGVSSSGKIVETCFLVVYFLEGKKNGEEREKGKVGREEKRKPEWKRKLIE